MNKGIDDEQFELDLSSGTANVRSFAPKKKAAAPDAATTKELLEKGLEIFAQELAEDAKGFFSLIFDKDNNPRIISAGEIDIVAALGSLEMAKNELYNNIFLDVE